MKVIVTGGAGFIGSHIVDRLIDDGMKVVVIDNLTSGSKENVNPGAKVYEVDIRDEKVPKIFAIEKPNFVFHHAAQIDVGTSIKNPIFDAEVNLIGTLRLFDICIENKVKKIVVPSSAAIYGDTKQIPTPEDIVKIPTMPYAFGKLAVEQYAEFYSRFYKLDITLLRYSNVYGPRQASPGEGVVIQKFISKYLINERPTINGDGNQTRDFIYVSDVVEANIKATKNKVLGPINVSTAKETSVNDLAKKIKDITGKKLRPKYRPAKLHEVYRSCLENKLARKLLNWRPKISLDDGLRKTVNWFETNGKS